MSQVRLQTYGAYGWPKCDVCDKDVERIESAWDVNRDARRFRVLCHGEWEEAELTALTTVEADNIEFGRAFVRPRLTGQPGKLACPGGTNTGTGTGTKRDKTGRNGTKDINETGQNGTTT